MRIVEEKYSARVARLAWRTAFAVALVFSFQTADAATLTLSPASGSFRVGDAFSVYITAGSPDQSMNAAEGVLSFPPDKLQVASVGKEGSVIGLWAQEPSFSNSAGTVNFEGVVLNPGFTGASGRILRVTFRARAAGSAALSFSSGSVLASDGQGTNILTDLGRAQFAFSAASAPAPSAPSEPAASGAGTPEAPEITSDTHPDQAKWYNKTTAHLSWKLPKGVTAVATLLSRRATAEPSIVYSPPISEKTVTDLEDGAVYFHLQFKNKNGWGEVAHYKLQIDTVPPLPFKVQFPHGAASEDPRPIMLFSTTDGLSGIARYEIKVGDTEFFRLDPREIESNPYSPPPQEPGKKTVVVRAFDAAGNESVAASEFTVSAIPPPRLVDYPAALEEGEILRIRGIAEPQTEIEASVFEDEAMGEIGRAKANADGDFVLVWTKKLSVGTWQVRLRGTNVEGAQSLWSEPVEISVKRRAIATVGSFVLTYLSLAVIGIFLLGLLGAAGIYLWKRAKLARSAVAQEVAEARASVHKAFDLLRADMREQLALLSDAKSKRELTHEEKQIVKRLEKNLNDAEKFIGKEIKDIEDKMS